MRLFKKVTIILASMAGAMVPGASPASEVIAHRGLYHDVNNSRVVPENSYDAVSHAYQLGMRGVELDLRLSAENDVLVTHDMISNRTTTADNAGGRMNPVDIYLGIKAAPPASYINTLGSNIWGSVLLKAYGRNGQIVGGEASSYEMDDLVSMIQDIKKYAPTANAFNDPNFMIILDIQDPLILRTAAKIVKLYNVEKNVYLKFFASKALYNIPQYRYNGSDTCYAYAKDLELTGLNIIPQINDGELDIDEDDEAGINAFQTRLTPDQYLQCWADAQAQHPDAAKMSIVSASVPANNITASRGSAAALVWARNHGRKTMSIVPNPDVGRYYGGFCHYLSFQSSKVSAADFKMDARNAKAAFASQNNVDYIIWDVMGDFTQRRYYTDFNTYTNNLC